MLPLSPVAPAISFDQFQSPSGNIFCGIGSQAGGAFAECEVDDHSWASPPRPPNCDAGFGDRIGLHQGRPPGFGCHSDTLYGTGLPVLDYGQSRSAGPITCLSQSSGVTCTDNSSGHFFTVSKESYELG